MQVTSLTSRNWTNCVQFFSFFTTTTKCFVTFYHCSITKLQSLIVKNDVTLSHLVFLGEFIRFKFQFFLFWHRLGTFQAEHCSKFGLFGRFERDQVSCWSWVTTCLEENVRFRLVQSSVLPSSVSSKSRIFGFNPTLPLYWNWAANLDESRKGNPNNVPAKY